MAATAAPPQIPELTDAASPVYGDVDPEGGELHRRLAEIACALAIDEAV